MQYSVTYTIAFAAAVCLVCSLVVAITAVTLKPRQVANALLDKQRKVLAVAGLTPAGQKLSDQEVEDLFNANLEPKIVDLESGVYSDDVAPAAYDQRKASKDPDKSYAVPSNRAKVRRVPRYGLVYLIKPDNDVEGIIIPVEGMGLWGNLYGYLALNLPLPRIGHQIDWYRRGRKYPPHGIHQATHLVERGYQVIGSSDQAGDQAGACQRQLEVIEEIDGGDVVDGQLDPKAGAVDEEEGPHPGVFAGG